MLNFSYRLFGGPHALRGGAEPFSLEKTDVNSYRRYNEVNVFCRSKNIVFLKTNNGQLVSASQTLKNGDNGCYRGPVIGQENLGESPAFTYNIAQIL